MAHIVKFSLRSVPTSNYSVHNSGYCFLSFENSTFTRIQTLFSSLRTDVRNEPSFFLLFDTLQRELGRYWADMNDNRCGFYEWIYKIYSNLQYSIRFHSMYPWDDTYRFVDQHSHCECESIAIKKLRSSRICIWVNGSQAPAGSNHDFFLPASISIEGYGNLLEMSL